MSVASLEQYMRLYFPKLYAERKAAGRCLHCGAKRPHNFKVSDTPKGPGRISGHPATAGPHEHKEIA